MHAYSDASARTVVNKINFHYGNWYCLWYWKWSNASKRYGDHVNFQSKNWCDPNNSKISTLFSTSQVVYKRTLVVVSIVQAFLQNNVFIFQSWNIKKVFFTCTASERTSIFTVKIDIRTGIVLFRTPFFMSQQSILNHVLEYSLSYYYSYTKKRKDTYHHTPFFQGNGLRPPPLLFEICQKKRGTVSRGGCHTPLPWTF